MISSFKVYDQQAPYFVTFTVVDWIDVFIRDTYRQIFINSVKYCQHHKGFEVYAYCVMTNHIHMILRSGGEQPLAYILRDLKSFTSRHIRKAIEENDNMFESRQQWILKRMYSAGKYNSNMWQQGNHAIELGTKK